MNATQDFDRLVASWLETDGPADVRTDVVDAALGAAGRTGQRRGLRAWLIGPGAWPVYGRRLSFSGASPIIRIATLTVVVALLLGILAVAVAGALRSDPTKILTGQTGVLAYSVMDMPSRPYNHVHLVKADGTDDREVAQGSCPVFSTDGSLVAFWSGWAETRQLMIANADFSNSRVVPDRGKTEVEALPPDFVPFTRGNTWIAALSPDFAQVAWLKAVGTNEIGTQSNQIFVHINEVWVSPVSGAPGIRVAPKSDIPNERYSDLLWSPDGRRLAFSGMSTVVDPTGSNSGEYRSSIYVVDADGSNLHRLSARPGWDTVQLSWSPDGRYLAYDGTPDGSPVPALSQANSATGLYPPLDIYVIRADGSGELNLTNTTSATERGPKWSPDGSRLAYYGQDVAGDPGWPIMTIGMADGVPTGQAVWGPVSGDFVWSPDGARLLLLDSQDTSASTGVVLEQDLPQGNQPQTFASQIRSIDAEFREAPVTLLADGHLISCVTWMRPQP